jgi:hypothetical protein
MTVLLVLVLAAAVAYGLHRLTTPKLIPARIERDDRPARRDETPGNDWDWSGQ